MSSFVPVRKKDEMVLFLWRQPDANRSLEVEGDGARVVYAVYSTYLYNPS